MTVFALLVALAILALVLWAIRMLVTDARVSRAMYVVTVLGFVLWLLASVGGGDGNFLSTRLW